MFGLIRPLYWFLSGEAIGHIIMICYNSRRYVLVITWCTLLGIRRVCINMMNSNDLLVISNMHRAKILGQIHMRNDQHTLRGFDGNRRFLGKWRTNNRSPATPRLWRGWSPRPIRPILASCNFVLHQRCVLISPYFVQSIHLVQLHASIILQTGLAESFGTSL